MNIFGTPPAPASSQAAPLESQSGGRFSADPNVGLYFTGNSGVPNAFAEGFVGPLRVWVGEAPPVTARGDSPD